ncbi:hypothetical protein [Sphingobium phenoxybenzoativorans]|uniref:hypothetical protein n=1 Tax=Sphingobium phenoxybenzoativorans TaxID=1592790 RepID=UPI000873253C|nr:hypothetical protein [Sphingobium phenoxybenzoativorans]
MTEPLTIFWETGQSIGDALLFHASDGRPILVKVSQASLMAAGEALPDDTLHRVGGFIAWLEIGIRNRYRVDEIDGSLHESPDGHLLFVQAEDLIIEPAAYSKH